MRLVARFVTFLNAHRGVQEIIGHRHSLYEVLWQNHFAAMRGIGACHALHF
jgi:hypothetical protein